MKKKIIAIDFDGVINSYKPGWIDIDIIPEPPVTGAIVWLEMLVRDKDYIVMIYSTRTMDYGEPNSSKHGRKAIQNYLIHWGLPSILIDLIEFPVEKPKAHMFIDDRAFKFEGKFPDKLEIDNFKSWVEK